MKSSIQGEDCYQKSCDPLLQCLKDFELLIELERKNILHENIDFIIAQNAALYNYFYISQFT